MFTSPPHHPCTYSLTPPHDTSTLPITARRKYCYFIHVYIAHVFYHPIIPGSCIPLSSLHRCCLRLSCKAGTRVLVVWRLINGRLSAIFILVCSTILVLASSVNLILTLCRHPSSYPFVRICLRHARPLGVGRSELEPGLEPGAISSLIATSTSTDFSWTSLGNYHYLHQVKWGFSSSSNWWFSVYQDDYFYRIFISIFVLDSNWSKGSALCFEPGFAMIPSAMAFVSSFPSQAPRSISIPMPHALINFDISLSPQSPLVYDVSLYISNVYPTTIVLLA